MTHSKWWDKCVEVNALPEALLKAQGNGKPTSKCVGPMSPRSLVRWSRSCWLKILFGSFLLIVFVLYLRHLYCDGTDGGVMYRHYEKKFRNGVSNDTLSMYLWELTKEPHVAGTSENFDTADYVYDRFVEAGINARYTDYNVFLSYPVSRYLSLTGSSGDDGGFNLTEQYFDDDEFTKNPKIMSTFHGYSPSGNVSGPVVYANYGSEEDFAYLCKKKVNITGAIVLARYREISPGNIVSNAESHGAVGVVIFPDPIDFANNDTEGYYPHSQWLPPTGVQRATVRRRRGGVGDPLTPGWPSTSGNERLHPKDAELPGIPSLPISGIDAHRILRGLDGTLAPLSWRGGFDEDCYRISRGPARLNLTYVARQGVYGIRNVIGVIEGSEEPDRYVVLGNHRDAFVFGAVDPGSGTASLLEMVRGFGILLRQGWKPRRTIILGSWDAKEYGMIGSTEWVEENLGMLGARAAVYINVDAGVSGPGFVASATPQLDTVLQAITQDVTDPDGHYATVFDAWQAAIQTSTGAPKIFRMGNGDSDFVAFLLHAGIPSIDLHFGTQEPIYHSVYDDYNWMVRFGDHDFQRHVALTQIWGMLTLRLADEAVLPFDFLIYARELQQYVKALIAHLEEIEAPSDVDTSPLHSAVVDLLKAAAYIRQEINVFQTFRSDPIEFFMDLLRRRPSNDALVSADGSFLDENELPELEKSWYKRVTDFIYFLLRRRAINDRLLYAERSFLDQNGLPGTGGSWYKHLVYGPTSHSLSRANTNFPGILDKIPKAPPADNSTARHWEPLQHEIWRATRAINQVSAVLQGTIT